MDINQAIRDYSSQPIPHHLLISLLKDYKRPNDKINSLKSKGIIESIKKGLYIAGPALKTPKPESEILANHIYGPSYVSLDTALVYYGIIPERVYEVTSMTIKASKEFNTAVGLFTYTHLPLPYYSFGLTALKILNEHRALIASPEKALCDKIVSTPGILLRSTKQAFTYLVENLRMDENALKKMDVAVIDRWLPDAPKKESLLMATKMIRTL